MRRANTVFYEIVIWSTLALGLVPLARTEMRRAAERRPSREPGSYQGSHARPSSPDESEPRWSRGDAVRIAAASLIGTLVVIAKPHGIAYWLALAAALMLLLWEPAGWFTAYLVRRANRQDG